MARIALAGIVVLVVVLGVGGIALGARGGASALPTSHELLVFTQVWKKNPSEDPWLTIYTARLDGSGVRRLTAPCVDCSSDPAWSPSGSLIAYTGTTPSFSGTMVMSRTGSRKRRVAPDCDDPTWSPDGTQIACSLIWERGQIAIVSLRDRKLRLVPHLAYAYDLDWSPDGKRFAFRREAFGSPDGVYVANIDGTGLHLIAKDTEQPRWSPNGKTLLATRQDGGGTVLINLAHHTTRLNRKVLFPTWAPSGDAIAAFDPSALLILNLRTDREQRIQMRPNVCRVGCLYEDWSP